MANNIAKKVSWSGEGTPLLNGAEESRYSGQVSKQKHKQQLTLRFVTVREITK